MLVCSAVSSAYQALLQLPCTRLLLAAGCIYAVWSSADAAKDDANLICASWGLTANNKIILMHLPQLAGAPADAADQHGLELTAAVLRIHTYTHTYLHIRGSYVSLCDLFGPPAGLDRLSCLCIFTVLTISTVYMAKGGAALHNATSIACWVVSVGAAGSTLSGHPHVHKQTQLLCQGSCCTHTHGPLMLFVLHVVCMPRPRG